MKINKWFLTIAFMASLFLVSNIDAKDTSFLHSEKVGQGLANGLNFEGQWIWTHFAEGTGVPTPPTGTIYLYTKTDKSLYMKDDTGTETQIGEGSGAHNANDTLSNLVSPTAVNQHLSPGADNTYDLGVGTTHEWRDIWIDGIAFIDTLDAGRTLSLIPFLDDTYDLGDGTHHFRDFFLSGDAIIKQTLTVTGRINDVFIEGVTSTVNIFIGDTTPSGVGGEIIRIGFNSGTNMGAGATENILIGDSVAPTLPFDALRNVMIGHNIFTGITLTAVNNVVIGNTSAPSVTQPVENVIIGDSILSAVATQCDRNVIIGNAIAGASTQTTENVLIGHNIDGSDVGTTFNRSIIIGHQTQAITGVNNDFLNIGDLILGDLANGFVRIGGPITKPTTDEFVVVGTIAGEDIDASAHINGMRIDANSTSFSFAELGNDILISNMVRLGHGALGNAGLTGDQNIAIGTDAGNAMLGGNENVMIGQNAMLGATTAAENVAIGHGAMDSSVGDFHNNVAVGQLAASDFTGGNDNVWIGDDAGNVHQTGDGNIFIGSGALSPSADIDDFCNIGGAIFGDMAGDRWVIGGSAAKPTGDSQLELDSALANLLLNRVSTTNDAGFNVAGEIWYNHTANEFRGVVNGTQVSFDVTSVPAANNVGISTMTKNELVERVEELLARVEALESPGVILNRRVDALEAQNKLLKGKIMVLQPVKESVF